MDYRKLFLLVEGNDDIRFFETIIKPELQKKYSLKTIRYANMKKEKIGNLINSFGSMGADYIYFTDINNSPCATAKKHEIKEQLKDVNEKSIIVVIKEIESWYLAGLNDKNSKKLKIKSLENTDKITKEQFNRLIPKKFDSRIDFMIEILNHFSIETIETAEQKNRSFGYFMGKYDCEFS